MPFICCSKSSVSGVIEPSNKTEKTSTTPLSQVQTTPQAEDKIKQLQKANMDLLYLLKVNFTAWKFAELKPRLKLWIDKLGEDADVKHSFKVAGEGTLVIVIGVNNVEKLEYLNDLSLVDLDQRCQVEVIPIIPYEDFATDLWRRNKIDDKCEIITPVVTSAKLLYWLTFTAEYQGKTQEELFDIWGKEAKAALAAKKVGAVLDLFKVVAERKVQVFLAVDDPQVTDKLSFDLPIMKMMGDQVHIQCKSVLRHDIK